MYEWISIYLTCDSYLGGADIVCDDDIKLGALRLNESSGSWIISAATESHFQYHNYKATYCFDFQNVRHHEIGTCLISNMRSSSLSRFWTISSDLWTSWRLEAPQYKCFFPTQPSFLHKSNIAQVKHISFYIYSILPFSHLMILDVYRTRVRSLAMLVTHSLTHWLTDSLTAV